MDAKTLNVMRTILLVLTILLLGLSLVLFIKNGTFNLSTIITAVGCLLIYLVTKKKQN